MEEGHGDHRFSGHQMKILCQAERDLGRYTLERSVFAPFPQSPSSSERHGGLLIVAGLCASRATLSLSKFLLPYPMVIKLAAHLLSSRPFRPSSKNEFTQISKAPSRGAAQLTNRVIFIYIFRRFLCALTVFSEEWKHNPQIWWRLREFRRVQLLSAFRFSAAKSRSHLRMDIFPSAATTKPSWVVQRLSCGRHRTTRLRRFIPLIPSSRNCCFIYFRMTGGSSSALIPSPSARNSSKVGDMSSHSITQIALGTSSSHNPRPVCNAIPSTFPQLKMSHTTNGGRPKRTVLCQARGIPLQTYRRWGCPNSARITPILRHRKPLPGL